MNSRSTPLTPLSQALEEMLERKGLGQKLAQYAMFEDWEKIVGASLAERTQPLKIQGQQLVVAVEHPTWIQELQFMKPKILERIREIFPDTTLSDLRFVLKG